MAATVRGDQVKPGDTLELLATDGHHVFADVAAVAPHDHLASAHIAAHLATTGRGVEITLLDAADYDVVRLLPAACAPLALLPGRDDHGGEDL